MGKIQVTVQTEKRLHAITELSEAIKYVARALSLPPQVIISNNVIKAGENASAIEINSEDVEITETKIIETDDD